LVLGFRHGRELGRALGMRRREQAKIGCCICLFALIVKHRLDPDDLTLVTGAGGFIGGHLVADLRRRGHRRLRAVDLKPFDQWFQRFDDVDNRVLDLRMKEACHLATSEARYVFNLAADMGGMGFIELNKALCMTTVLINTHMLMGARDAGVERFFFSSSACVYAADKLTSAAVVPLREEDAYPAMPEDGYGWEKLFSERMCDTSAKISPHDARGALPQCVRAIRHPRRRPRESAGRYLPEVGRGSAVRIPVNRDLGRWGTDAQLHLYRRLRRGNVEANGK
jgi:hypothetical protein